MCLGAGVEDDAVFMTDILDGVLVASRDHKLPSNGHGECGAVDGHRDSAFSHVKDL